MVHRYLSRRLGVLCLALGLALAVPALAAPALRVQGVLRNSQGGPAADGNYPVTFRLYPAVDAKQAVWTEVKVAVPVQAGLFAATLGEDALPGQALTPQLFADHPELWLGVQVSVDPELPRQRLDAVASAFVAWHAQVAATAKALDCTGCIGAEHLKPGSLDAKNIAYLQGGKPTTVQAALGALDGALKVDGSSVGVGKPPAAVCAFDVGTEGGLTCVDGAPALLTRFAGNDAEMAKLQKTGQIVYRTDVDQAFLYRKGLWRKLQFTAMCGDGDVEPGEQCDDGQGNADAPNKCKTTCTKPFCGDKLVDAGEQCDDANDDEGDACAKCQNAKCGDGFLHKGVEGCDDGNALDTDACVACQPAKCGDGKVQQGIEQCDDGNANNDDACVACKTAACGDGFLHKGVEVCENGQLGSATCASVLGKPTAQGQLGCQGDCAAYDTSKCTVGVFTGTTLLSDTQQTQLNTWAGLSGQQWQLCYKRTVDGANVSTFHSKCNGKGPTFTVYKVNSGQVFGGYTTVSWHSSNNYSNDGSAFLFSVSKGTKHAPTKPQYAIYGGADYGPTFGGGHDIYVEPNMTKGYTNFSHSYQCPGDCQNYLAGSYSSWSLDEIEVFYKK